MNPARLPSESDELKNLSDGPGLDLQPVEPVAVPPFGAAVSAGVLSLILALWAAQSVAERFGIGWLVFPSGVILSLAVTFTILYRSHWHREMSPVRRALALMLLSCATLAGSACFFWVVVAAVCTVCAGFTNWHY